MLQISLPLMNNQTMATGFRSFFGSWTLFLRGNKTRDAQTLRIYIFFMSIPTLKLDCQEQGFFAIYFSYLLKIHLSITKCRQIRHPIYIYRSLRLLLYWNANIISKSETKTQVRNVTANFVNIIRTSTVTLSTNTSCVFVSKPTWLFIYIDDSLS